MAIEKSYFRQVMGQFTTGVSVVTTGGKGKPAGITVNAFCSVSLDPPLVLVCIDLISNTLPFIRENRSFAVNILTDKQEELSRCFAGSTQERYEEFCHAKFHLAATGSPIIDGSLAFIDARVVAEYPGGDHVIFLGQVEAMGIHGHEVVFANEEGQEHVTLNENHNNEAQNDIEPLAYYEGKYRHLTCDYVKPSLSKSETRPVQRDGLAWKQAGPALTSLSHQSSAAAED